MLKVSFEIVQLTFCQNSKLFRIILAETTFKVSFTLVTLVAIGFSNIDYVNRSVLLYTLSITIDWVAFVFKLNQIISKEMSQASKVRQFHLLIYYINIDKR